MYRLYIDESGDHTYKMLHNPGHKYLCLLGVWFQIGQSSPYNQFSDDLETFKRSYFGCFPDDPTILHASEIKSRAGRFKVLTNEKAREQFDKKLIALIDNSTFKVICVIIDKQKQLNKYSSPWHPYHYCVEAMLDRYCGWLKYFNFTGDVMAESRGKSADHELKSAYKHVYKNGTNMYQCQHHQSTLSSREIKIKPKTLNIAGLQLADILSGCMRKCILYDTGNITAVPSQFSRNLYNVAQKKYNCHFSTGRVQGYGYVLL